MPLLLRKAVVAALGSRSSSGTLPAQPPLGQRAVKGWPPSEQQMRARRFSESCSGAAEAALLEAAPCDPIHVRMR